MGDLLQSLPAITALGEKSAASLFDLLCPMPLTSLGELFPGIQRTIAWNGEDWHTLAMEWDQYSTDTLPHAVEYFSRFPHTPYSVAYNLNNHPRSILASHLLSERVIGAGDQGPLCLHCPPWVEHLRQVARERGNNRIHLADAFCGVCGVHPPTVVPSLNVNKGALPPELAWLVKGSSSLQIGIVLGAGDLDRRIPLSVWHAFIQSCTERIPHCRIFIIGGPGEREASMVLEHDLPSHTRNQVINCCGRTSFPQLVALFDRCQWVVGSDTGPLHLGVACGARAVGWYFSRARIHETGPYGEGHWVLQAESPAGAKHESASAVTPIQWPVRESLDLMIEGNCQSISEGWNVWKSHRDSLGVFYSELHHSPIPSVERERTWQRLGRVTEVVQNSTMEMARSS